MKKISRTRGIIISLGGAIVVTFLIARSVMAVGGPRVQMVMMTGTVKAGEAIKESDIRTEPMPAKFAVNAVTNEKDAIGKLAANKLTPGHPLLKSDISNQPMQDGLYVGEVGVRIPVDLVSSGGAMPGDYVDVLVSNGRQISGQPSALATLLQHKRVVAVFNAGGQNIQSTTNASLAGSLSMTPSQVYTPASVEIAVSSTQERDEVLSAGKVVLSLSPWGEANTPTSTSVSAPAGPNGTVVPPSSIAPAQSSPGQVPAGQNPSRNVPTTGPDNQAK